MYFAVLQFLDPEFLLDQYLTSHWTNSWSVRL